jgi:hypothetical protein
MKPEERRTIMGGGRAAAGWFNRAEFGLGIAFAVWLLDCYASSGSLDLSIRVGISPCRSSNARMRAASLVKSHRWQ